MVCSVNVVSGRGLYEFIKRFFDPFPFGDNIRCCVGSE